MSDAERQQREQAKKIAALVIKQMSEKEREQAGRATKQLVETLSRAVKLLVHEAPRPRHA